MAFPSTPLEVRVDLAVDGAWTDVTGDVLIRDAITISRGRADEASRADPSTAALTLENRDGRYSPRNPVGALYGKIGRNSPLRVGVGAPPIAAAAKSTVDSTSLVAPSVTAEATGLQVVVWAATPTGDITLPGGFTAVGSETDTVMTVRRARKNSVGAGATGTATATHSVTATEQATLNLHFPGATDMTSFAPLTASAGADAGGSISVTEGDLLLVVTGWSADPDNRMQPPKVTQPVGTGWLLLADSGPSDGPRLAAWVRRAVATESVTTSLAGAASGSTIGSTTGTFLWLAVITGATAYYPRHVGEVSTWPQRWDLSGVDVYTPITASGISRRLGQGQAPLRSSLYRYISRADNVVAYWPLEDAADAVRFASPIVGVLSGEKRGTPQLAADDGFDGSEAVPTFNAAGFVGRVPAHTSTGQVWAGALFSIPAAGTANNANLLSLELSGGTIARAVVEYRTGGVLGLKLVAPDGSTLFDDDAAFGFIGIRCYIWLTLRQSGADVIAQLAGIGIEPGVINPTPGILNSVPGATVTSQTLGRSKSIAIGIEGDGALSFTSDVAAGHVTIATMEQAVFRSDVAFTYGNPAIIGYLGEAAHERVRRLCREEGILAYVQHSADSEMMGPQRPETLLELLSECEDTDGGILYEPAGFLGFGYRTRASMQNQQGV